MKAADQLVLAVEGIGAVIVAVLLTWLPLGSLTPLGFEWALASLPVLWFAFRRGPLWGIALGVLVGIVVALFLASDQSAGERVALVVAYAGWGLAGCFARYLQRTLHNRRLSSTYLNMVTGTLLALLWYFVLELVSAQWLSADVAVFSDDVIRFTVSWLVSAAIDIAVFAGVIQWRPELLIPRHTPYISRRERSHLLND